MGLVFHSVQALVWTQSLRVLMPPPKVMLHMHMLLPTEPGTESVRPKLTHSSSPLPHMLDTPDMPLLLPTLLLLFLEDLSTLPSSESAPTLPELRSHAKKFFPSCMLVTW